MISDSFIGVSIAFPIFLASLKHRPILKLEYHYCPILGIAPHFKEWVIWVICMDMQHISAFAEPATNLGGFRFEFAEFDSARAQQVAELANKEVQDHIAKTRGVGSRSNLW